jgi:hypothetical protein
VKQSLRQFPRDRGQPFRHRVAVGGLADLDGDERGEL